MVYVLVQSWKSGPNNIQRVVVTSHHHTPLAAQQSPAVVDVGTGLGRGPEVQSLVPTYTC